ncbi:S9 family peptidase [Canibacter zhoujuaniae]|uniref:S9 family peptidase n=1 Tax=Canibacter zhoujuaniae TaxID=2708343 RepID=UPI00141EA3D8|nr:S9 family peptidase [Canibacter zhoujuaniae]
MTFQAASLPPVPAKKPIKRTHHGDTVVDNFDWLREKESQEVLDHLHAENAYADEILTPLHGLRDRIVAEVKSHTQETDSSVPYRDGDFWYISRTREGDNYPRFSRISVAHSPELPQLDAASDELLDGEEVFLDAQALAAGCEFFQIGGFTINEPANLLAYSVDTTGGEVFDLRIVDLSTGRVIDDAVKNVAYGLDFSVDGSKIVYAKNDAAWRQCEIWVHTVGADAATDRLIYRENDEKYTTYAAASRGGEALLIHAESHAGCEVFTVPLADPDTTPVSVAGRVADVEYSVEHAGDHYLVIHNRDHVGFSLARQELNVTGAAAQDTWVEIMAPQKGERIEAVDAFKGHAAVTMRAAGLPAIRVLPRALPESGSESGWHTGDAWDISHGGELDAVYLAHNRNWDSDTIRYTLESLLTPTTVAEVAATGGQPNILKVTEVPNFERSNYVEKRLWATAKDGTQVPISLMARADVQPDGTNPGFLYGYGSYEVPIDPSFNVLWLSLVDRGVVVAIAHVRGGGEMGREWYLDGKLANKKNSFSDFVDSAHFLTNEGWFDGDRIAAEGRSAGGLLMGAMVNLSPATFRAVLAGVPFVDALTTILDPTLPLTVGEWEEWGNPLESAEIYQYMKEYSPYENIKHEKYPAILATTSLNDIRVFYVEPAKWVARLREETTNYESGAALPERPIAFKCEMVAGHGGRSGRYARWEQRAEEYAFLLDQIGATELE